MSHLHIPDGVHAALVWIAGPLLAPVGVLVSAAFTRRRPQRIVPERARRAHARRDGDPGADHGAFDYCMTLAGPVGIPVGPASTFQVCFVVTVIPRAHGGGGFTVIGLNALVLRARRDVPRPVYGMPAGRLKRPHAVAIATAVSQLLERVVDRGARGDVKLSPSAAAEVHTRCAGCRGARFVAMLAPLLLVAVTVESLLALGLATFLDRVRPGFVARRRLRRRGAARRGAAVINTFAQIDQYASAGHGVAPRERALQAALHARHDRRRGLHAGLGALLVFLAVAVLLALTAPALRSCCSRPRRRSSSPRCGCSR